MRSAVVPGNLTEFFRELVREAMDSQRVRSSEDSEFYLVRLLESFARPAPEWFSRPLALDYLESFQAPMGDRYAKLKRVADTSLFLAGMFTDTVDRTVVGGEYYVNLGRLSYEHLATTPQSAFGHPFEELAARFRQFVAVLGDISFNAFFAGDRQTMRVFTRWLHSRSPRDEAWLVKRGLIPVRSDFKVRH